MSHYHLTGVAGVGMSALAEYLHMSGHQVSGSDRFADQGRELPVLKVLRELGVKIFSQDGAGISKQTTAVVTSTAIESDNPEIARAFSLGVPVIHRSEMLQSLADGKRVIAIAGTSGKTTITGMVGWILSEAGCDPSVLNGGGLVDWMSSASTGSVRVGSSDLFVIEADESDRSLLRYTPEIAVISNISADHYDLETSEDIFRAFSRNTTGSVVGFESVANVVNGGAEFISVLSCEVTEERGLTHFSHAGERWTISVPGAHNATNAMLASAVCQRIGVDPSVCRDVLSRFRGMHRRLQRTGLFKGAEVYDDYAHNPAKISAVVSTLQGFSNRVFAVWRPHGFKPLASMRKDMVRELASIMRPADRFFMLPVFFAGGSVDRVLDSDAVVPELTGAGIQATYVSDYDQTLELLVREVKKSDAILILGARDPELPEFATRLAGYSS